MGEWRKEGDTMEGERKKGDEKQGRRKEGDEREEGSKEEDEMEGERKEIREGGRNEERRQDGKLLVCFTNVPPGLRQSFPNIP